MGKGYLQNLPEGYKCLLCEKKHMGPSEAGDHLIKCEKLWQFESTEDYTILIGKVAEVGALNDWGTPPGCYFMDKTSESPEQTTYQSCKQPAVYRVRLFGGRVFSPFDRLSCEQHRDNILKSFRVTIKQNQDIEAYLKSRGFNSVNEAVAQLDLDIPEERRKDTMFEPEKEQPFD